MTVHPGMPSFDCERRHGLFAESGKLGQAIQANLKELGYGR
jgi:hypothetical protein